MVSVLMIVHGNLTGHRYVDLIVRPVVFYLPSAFLETSSSRTKAHAHTDPVLPSTLRQQGANCRGKHVAD